MPSGHPVLEKGDNAELQQVIAITFNLHREL